MKESGESNGATVLSILLAIPILEILVHLIAALILLITSATTGNPNEKKARQPYEQNSELVEKHSGQADQNPDENDTVRESLPKEHQLFKDGLIK